MVSEISYELILFHRPTTIRVYLIGYVRDYAAQTYEISDVPIGQFQKVCIRVIIHSLMDKQTL